MDGERTFRTITIDTQTYLEHSALAIPSPCEQCDTLHIGLGSSGRRLKAGSFREQSPHACVNAPERRTDGSLSSSPVLSEGQSPVLQNRIWGQCP